jgi:NTP pyrophosphatase (non-canonical NTP hydrolase)
VDKEQIFKSAKLLEEVIELIDEIFSKNEKICENGISSFDCIDRLTEINEQLADIQVVLGNILETKNEK